MKSSACRPGGVLRRRSGLCRFRPNHRRGGHRSARTRGPAGTGAGVVARRPPHARNSLCRSAAATCRAADRARRRPGIVVFAHGSGSSRYSPRNRYVAETLNDAGLGTLLFDLLTVDEEADRGNVFDIELLARRLLEVTSWLRTMPEHPAPYRLLRRQHRRSRRAVRRRRPRRGRRGRGIPRRAARPRRPQLALVCAPTLLIVGGYDDVVLELNRSRSGPAALREPAGDRARRDPPVRRARRARRRRPPHRQLVRYPPHTAAVSRSGRREALDLRATNRPFRMTRPRRCCKSSWPKGPR